MVLGNLVLHHTEPGVAHRHLGQGPVAPGIHDGPSGRHNGAVNLLLVPLLELTLSCACPVDQFLDYRTFELNPVTLGT